MRRRYSVKQRLLLLAIVVCVLAATPALCWNNPENVLVVRNGNSVTSMNIADYYVARRGIPAGNVVTVFTIDSSISSANETISNASYLSQIETPILNYLTANGLTNTIQYIVLTKGIPIRTSAAYNGFPTHNKSVDSMLAALNLVTYNAVNFIDDKGTPQTSDDIYYGTVYANYYWNNPNTFTHQSLGGYIVTRLDGYTEDDAKALVDNALAPRTPSKYFLLDEDLSRGLGDPNAQPKSILQPGYELRYFDYNADMAKAAQTIMGRPNIVVNLDQTNSFISGSDLSGYVSWGSNDNHYLPNVYHSLTFAPGGIAETAVSTSGRTFLPTTGGQSLIADLIAQGVSGVKGYTDEPLLDAIASPTVLFDFYTSGRTLGESFYAASRLLGWRDIIIGDPLCTLDITPATHTVSGTVNLQNFGGDKTIIPITIEIRKPGTSEVIETQTVTLDTNGGFSFTTEQNGGVDLALKASHWLRRVVRNVMIRE